MVVGRGGGGLSGVREGGKGILIASLTSLLRLGDGDIAKSRGIEDVPALSGGGGGLRGLRGEEGERVGTHRSSGIHSLLLVDSSSDGGTVGLLSIGGLLLRDGSSKTPIKCVLILILIIASKSFVVG